MGVRETIAGAAEAVADQLRPARKRQEPTGLAGLRFFDGSGHLVAAMDLELEASARLSIEVEHGLVDITDDDTPEGTHDFMLIPQEEN